MKVLRRHWLLADLAALQAMFLGIRLAGVVRWPWWLVLAPLWVPAAAVVVFLGFDLFALSRWGRRR